MKPNECHAYFALRGFPMDPKEVSSMLGLTASKSWRAGDPHDAHRIPGKVRDDSFWCIESRITRDAEFSFEDHVSDVLAQLGPHFDLAVTLSKAHRGLIELVGYFHQFYPGLNFRPSTLQRLAELNVEMDCDFYYLAPQEELPNKTLEQTPTSVTDRADARSAPAAGAAHL